MQPLRLLLLLVLSASVLGQISGPLTHTTDNYGPAYQVATTPAPTNIAFFNMDQPPTVAFWTAFNNRDNAAPVTDEGGAVTYPGERFDIPESGLYWIQLNILSDTCSRHVNHDTIYCTPVIRVQLHVNGAEVSGTIMQITINSNGTHYGYGSNTVILPLRKYDEVSVWKLPVRNGLEFAVSHYTYVLSTINGIKIADI